MTHKISCNASHPKCQVTMNITVKKVILLLLTFVYRFTLTIKLKRTNKNVSSTGPERLISVDTFSTNPHMGQACSFPGKVGHREPL